MARSKLLFGMLILFSFSCPAMGQTTKETVEFPSEDGILITADVYWKDKNDRRLPFICLFHQAGYSRGEYAEIAPRLVRLGYNCMAVDLRSGRKVNDVENETAKRAVEAGKDIGSDFMRAYPDIVAALTYAREQLAQGQLIAWGSSYSASLLFKAGSDHEALVDGIIAFSANDITKWTRGWISDAADAIKYPVFLSSSRREKGNWKRLQDKLPEDQVTAFVPASAGRHGSSALWSSTRDNSNYWTAVEEFLLSRFPPQSAPTGESVNPQTPAQLATATDSLSNSGPPFASVPVAGAPSVSDTVSGAETPNGGQSERGHGGQSDRGHGHGTEEPE